MPFYAVYTGHIRNEVFQTWEECKPETIKRAKFKKFDTLEEAQRFQKYGPFGTEEEFDTCIYTDGSAIQKHGEFYGGYGIYYGKGDPRNASVYLGKVTNNVAELTAVRDAVRTLTEKSAVYTDSTYALLCCTTYGEKCEKKKWKDDIPNKELVRETYELCKSKPFVSLVHISAHTLKQDRHSLGNEAADLLAKESIKNVGI
jgi:ribonuclease HI